MAHLDLSSRVVIVLALLGACACDRPSSAGPGTAPTPATEPAPTVFSGAPTTLDVSNLGDPGLAAVLRSLHTRIAQEAQIGATSARAREVKDMAHETSLFHTDALTTYQGLFQRLSIVPRANRTSSLIDGDGANAMQALRGTRGATFDEDYLAWQSRALGEALELSDRILAAAKSAELRSEVARNRSELQAQLQTVSRLQQSLNRGVTNQQAPY
jgi:uncharacterized protein DUF4142